MCANEFLRSSAFFLQKGCFTQLGILMHLFVTRDAIQLAGGLVVNRIVSHPQFEWKIRADRYETVELNGVADGPGQGKKNRERKNQGNVGRSMKLRGTYPQINA